MPDLLSGWCPRWGPPWTPHYVDLLLTSNAPAHMCPACTAAWIRDDPKESPQ